MLHSVQKDSAYAWLLAARPKTLAGSLAPVFVGCALAFWMGKFNIVPALLCMAFAVLMQIASNFINDLCDFLKGNDREDRLGPRRACAEGWISPNKMKKGIIFVIICAFLAGIPLTLYGGKEMLYVAFICVVFAFLYSAGPYPLSQKGWGDVLVLIFFGIVPVGFTCYVQSGQWTPQLTLCGIAVGTSIDLLLTINNFRDRDQDRISGKKTLIVRFGEEFGLRFYLALGGFACAFSLCLIPHGMFFAALLPLLFLFPHYRVWHLIAEINHGRELNRCLGLTSRNLLIFSMLLSFGILLDAFF